MEGSPKADRRAQQQQPEQQADTSASSGDKSWDEALEQGYFGETLDPTPDENYTLKGVVAGKPTPETDPEMKAKAREVRAEHEARLSSGE